MSEHSKHHHSHSHNHSHIHSHSADKNILVAFFLNLFFVFVEITGGLLTNSFAILSDAVHDCGDCVAIGFAYLMEKFSNKEPDEKYTYGYRRYSLLSAIVTSVILIVGSIFIIIGAIKRFAQPKEIQGFGMVIIAVFGVVINSIAVFKTHKGTGVNERAISLHLLEDVLGWIAVLIGSLFIYFFRWYFVDGLLSVLIAGFLLFESTKNIKDIFTILLEKTPDNIDVAGFRARVEEMDEVENIHHLHVWSLDGEKTMATVHVKLRRGVAFSAFESVKSGVEALARSFSIEHITIQIDTDNCQGENPCDL